MKIDLYLKSIFGATLLTALYSLTIIILGLPQGQGFNVWSFFANYLIAIIIGYMIVHSSYHGLKLSFIVFVIHFLIGHFNTLIEAFVFNVTDRSETIQHMFVGLLITAAFSPIYIYLFKEKKSIVTPKFIARTYISWVWRIIAGNFIYTFFYIIAGLTLTFVYPDFMQFYEGKIPPVALIFKTQLFLRGFIFIAVAVLILRTLNLTSLKKSILVGLVFSILGGIAPLIQPNDLMPDYVRWGHLFEVGISNFLYGLVLGYLLRQKPQDENVSTAN